MSRESLARLQEAQRSTRRPLRGELHELHVPFDEMTNDRGCEQPLGDALRRGQRVALVGISGSGKSSVTQSVLGPLVEGLAPLQITEAIERPEIAQDPAKFAGHLVRLGGQWVAHAMPKKGPRRPSDRDVRREDEPANVQHRARLADREGRAGV
jgi:hypothetical protein